MYGFNDEHFEGGRQSLTGVSFFLLPRHPPKKGTLATPSVLLILFLNTHIFFNGRG